MKVASFYRFLDVEDPAALRDSLVTVCEREQLLGTILVAREGFNGTLAGSEEGIQAVLHTFELPLLGSFLRCTQLLRMLVDVCHRLISHDL